MSMKFISEGPRKSAAFTLMELLITIAILGILAAIAIPNYTAYIARGNRSDARTTLLSAAQWMERYRAENNSYAAPDVPSGFKYSPSSGAAKYAIQLSNATVSTYSLTATPQGSMASDDCGIYSIDNTGARTAAGVSSGSTYSRCWEK